MGRNISTQPQNHFIKLTLNNKTLYILHAHVFNKQKSALVFQVKRGTIIQWFNESQNKIVLYGDEKWP